MTAAAELRLFDDDGVGAFHAADPWTSKAAAREVAHATRGLRFRILVELADLDDKHAAGGATAFELAAVFGVQSTTAGTRLRELVAVDPPLVTVTEQTRPTDTGRPAKVHRITLAGRRHVRDRREDAAQARHNRPHGAKPAGRTIQRTQSRYGLTAPRDRVLEELYNAAGYGLTDHDVAELVGILRTAAGTYRRQLEADGLVEDAHAFRPTPSGHRARVNRITELGRRTLRARARPE